jgi:phospholipid transport system substrate-binding protein
MVTRRSLIALMKATAVLITPNPLVRRALAQSSQQQAVAFVGGTAEQLVRIANSADSPQEKRRGLQQVVDRNVDVREIARFCLGRFWRMATAQEQQEYVALFGELLVTKIADHLGEYRGVRIAVGLARAAEDTEIVRTIVERPNRPPGRVDWVVSTATGAPKIIDLLADGSSLRLTQSGDFVAYLARHQYDVSEFIKALRQIVDRNG